MTDIGFSINPRARLALEAGGGLFARLLMAFSGTGGVRVARCLDQNRGDRSRYPGRVGPVRRGCDGVALGCEWLLVISWGS